MILFFTAIQNVFITIIMEGYEENRKKTQSQSKMIADTMREQAQAQKLLTATQNELEEDEYLDDKEMVIGKLKLNTSRVERMIDEMGKLLDDIENSSFK